MDAKHRCDGCRKTVDQVTPRGGRLLCETCLEWQEVGEKLFGWKKPEERGAAPGGRVRAQGL
jgi:hypothetical protein